MKTITQTILEALDDGESTYKFTTINNGSHETKTINLTRENAIEIVENELIGMSDFGVLEKYGSVQ
jgi:GTPase Era involved in 16S rRNA processing